MISSPRSAADDQEPFPDSDDASCPALLDLEGNFISSFLCGNSPSEPRDALPYPYASQQPDASRTLTRLTQRLVLDLAARKLGHDAYASSSSDSDEARASGVDSAVKGGARDRGGGSKVAKLASKAQSATVAIRERPAPGAAPPRDRTTRMAASSSEDEELDGFVRSDGDDISE
jgi:hypothetical protein